MRTEGLGMTQVLIYKNIIAGQQIWHINENEAKVKGHGEIRVRKRRSHKQTTL